MKQILLALSSSFFLYSCTKHEGDYTENIPQSSITFAKPTEGQVFRTGDSITIQGTAISTQTIHGFDIIIKKTEDTATLFFKHVHQHNDTLNISEAWKNTLTQPASLEAWVMLYLDHDGHTSTRRVGLQVQ